MGWITPPTWPLPPTLEGMRAQQRLARRRGRARLNLGTRSARRRLLRPYDWRLDGM